jgi:hypothetical protein
MDILLGCGWLVLFLFFLLLHNSCLPPFTFLDQIVFFIYFLNTLSLFVLFASSGSLFHSSTTLKQKLLFLTSVFACFLAMFHGLEDFLVFWVVLWAGNNFSGFILSILVSSVAEPEPPEPYHFDPRRTGTVSLLEVPVPALVSVPAPVPVAKKISN